MTDERTRLLTAIEGLPTDALNEVADFAEFVRYRRVENAGANRGDLRAESWQHLEAEFEGYAQRYPRG